VAAVERAVTAAGHVVVEMSDFGAADQMPAQVCAERVRGCDVYVGVLGTRYGSPVPDMPEKSYTELEFDTAAEAALDRLVFLLDTDAPDVGIPLAALIDRGFGDRQEAFRHRVQDSELAPQSFASPAELGQLVERSLRKLADTRARIDSGIARELVPPEPLVSSGGFDNEARWRVFISQTAELRDFPAGRSYVAAVERAISATGHVIVDMADFPDADPPTAQVCMDRVRACDVYVGMLGTRYGSPVRDRPEVSYTELEFDTAAEAGLDRLVFLLDTDAPDVGIPLAALIDREFGNRQDAFRGRVQNSGLVTQSFASPSALGQMVERSLRELAHVRARIDSGIAREQIPADQQLVGPPSPGGSGGDDLGARPGWRWDVALSFAGAQRSYVEQVAGALKARGLRCFYDADEQIELWGKYLAEELPAIYGEQAAAVVVFVSADYAARDWTRHERRAALTRAVRERREFVLPARFDDTPLPGLLSDMVTVDLRTRTPQQFAAMIASKLAALSITVPGLAGAGGPDQGSESAHPAGAVRAGEADPRRLGVHAAISVPGVPDEIPPEYVPRDVDDANSGVRVRVAAAAKRGGFVLLVGGPSVGKTRCAVEAVKDLLPDWWLIHPAAPSEVAAMTEVPTPQTVVWLDELQRYLDGEHGLTGWMVRALLNDPHPAVIVGTLWPDLYAAYVALPAPGAADLHAREREVLDLAAVVRIDPEFSSAEQSRAHTAAARDPRLRIALDAGGYGLTQTLAAAPQLVARWEDARTIDPYAWAVLTAALDAARLGARAPLSIDLLRAAAVDYCTSQQQAEAPGNWFEQAIAYATGKLHGAVAALSPTGAGMGRVAGYTVADYLIQHASRGRRSARVPASAWDALINHIRDPADAARLADSARSRLLYSYAIPLYRLATDAGDDEAARRLAELLAERGDLDGLRGRADAGDVDAAFRLAGLLDEAGDLDGAARILRALADAGDRQAASRLADLLAARGDVDGLRTRADADDEYAAARLADLLAERGDLDELRTRAGAGDAYAAQRLPGLLIKQGRGEEAERLRRFGLNPDGSIALA
jgi:hypothetical protein